MTENVNPYAPTVSHTADTQPAETPASSEPLWHLDDNTPGQGDRPEWMPSKFKKVSDVGRAYQELEKKLGAFTGAPDTYELGDLDLDGDQHLVKEMTSVAKEMNMSQEGLNKFLGRLASATEAESQVHLDEQVKALGKDGERMLVEFKNWQKDYFKPEEREVVSEWVRTADDLKVFNRIMAHTHMSTVPTANTPQRSVETVSELRTELAKNIDRYDRDKTYQKDWSSRMGRAVQREGGG